MATFITSPRECSSCCCVCPAPNGFGPDGNRVCRTYGPARVLSTDEPETPPILCYDVCDFCDNMVPEADMGRHACDEAQAVLAAIAREFIGHEAGEHTPNSDNEDENAPAVGGTP